MENQWSKELIEYTRNHFGDLGTTRLKNLKPGYYAAGYDTNLYIPDEVEERVSSISSSSKVLKVSISSHSIPSMR